MAQPRRIIRDRAVVADEWEHAAGGSLAKRRRDRAAR